MDKKKIDTLLAAIKDVVDEPGAWPEKAAAIMEQADDNEKAWLEEFVSWFFE